MRRIRKKRVPLAAVMGLCTFLLCGTETVLAQSEENMVRETADIVLQTEAAAVQEEMDAMVMGLYQQAISYAQTDEEKFASLFLNTDGEFLSELKEYFAMLGGEEYEKRIAFAALTGDRCCLAQFCSYTVTKEDEQPGGVQSKYAVTLAQTDDGWKFDNGEDIIDQLFTEENYNILYPAEWMEAYRDGRNITEFDTNDVMHLREDAVLEGIFTVQTKFLWQNEDGSVEAVFCLTNGTQEPVRVTELSLRVEDTLLGTVIDEKTSKMAEAQPVLEVPAGQKRIVTVHYEANRIQTGTQTWTDLHADWGYNGKEAGQ